MLVFVFDCVIKQVLISIKVIIYKGVEIGSKCTITLFTVKPSLQGNLNIFLLSIAHKNSLIYFLEICKKKKKTPSSVTVNSNVNFCCNINDNLFHHKLFLLFNEKMASKRLNFCLTFCTLTVLFTYKFTPQLYTVCISMGRTLWFVVTFYVSDHPYYIYASNVLEFQPSEIFFFVLWGNEEPNQNH